MKGSQYYLKNLDTMRPKSALSSKMKNPKYGKIGTAERFRPLKT